MVDEHYESEGHEEGEYHFSDDQINYDMDTATKDAGVAVASPKQSMADRLNRHRRMVIGIVVFIVLLGIVYKLVSPSSTPATDFQPAPPVNSIKKNIAPSSQAMTQSSQMPVHQSAQMTTQPVQPAQPEPAASVMQQPVAPVAQQPTSTVQQTTGSTTTAPSSPADRDVSERVAMLEQQNAAMMNLMQTQYAQKISETEMQNSQLRTQVQELNSRISNMEVAFRQLAKMLRNNASQQAATNRSMVASAAPPAVVQPRISYTVQAIIPGRAWLKSDSGDTVTVAEGDMLRGYGRITKIDPYDGVVDIDTGNRVVSLSYGATGD